MQSENKHDSDGMEESKEELNLPRLKQTQVASFDELETYKRVRKVRKKRAATRAVLWVLVILFMPIFIFATVVITSPNVAHNFFGYTFYVVTSESMTGVFDKGDLIVVKKVKSESELTVGTDISFLRQSDSETVTHRIISTITNENGEIEYITKGVHNQNADAGSVKYSDILGKRVAAIPALGKVITFFRTPQGIITFLSVFVLIIVAFIISFKHSNDIRAVGNG